MFSKLFHRDYITIESNHSKLYDNENFYDAYRSDLLKAQRRVVIESPFITSTRIEYLYPLFMELRSRGVEIVVNTKVPKEHNNAYKIQAEDAIAQMQMIGITVLFTVKHHRKLSIIDDDILWEGSLNILSQYDSCEIMRRSGSNSLVNQMLSFLCINQYY